MIRDCMENKKSDIGTRTQQSFFERAYQTQKNRLIINMQNNKLA